MISRSVLPRPPRQRARAPCLENKNSAPQARFRSQTPSKQAKVHAFWLPKQQCNQPQPPQPPHWSTRPTGPVDHPADPPTHRAPHPHPTLALGLRTLGAPGPPPGPCFPVFVFSRPPASSDPPGRPQTERSKTLRPAPSHCSEPLRRRRQAGSITCDSLPCNNWIDNAGWQQPTGATAIGGFSSNYVVPATPKKPWGTGQTLFYFIGAENTMVLRSRSQGRMHNCDRAT